MSQPQYQQAPSVAPIDVKPEGIDLDALVDREVNPGSNYTAVELNEYALFGWLRRDDPVRRVCIKIVSASWFHYVMLGVVLANTVFLAFAEDPTRPTGDVIAWLIFAGYILFNVIYWTEMIIQIIALGIRAYMRSPWRVFDWCLNIVGLAAIFPPLNQIGVMRSIRIFSAVRVFRSIRGLKALGDAILYSLPALFDIILVMLFLFTIYALVGMQTWLGEYRYRCVPNNYNNSSPPPIPTLPSWEVDRLCSMEDTRGRQCPSEYQCAITSLNPNYGFTGFDNFAMSFVTLFGMFSTDSWSFVMYYAQDIDGFPVWVYFVSFILLCTFFAANLIIAIIIVKYQEFAAKERAKEDLIAQLQTAQHDEESEDLIAHSAANISTQQHVLIPTPIDQPINTTAPAADDDSIPVQRDEGNNDNSDNEGGISTIKLRPHDLSNVEPGASGSGAAVPLPSPLSSLTGTAPDLLLHDENSVAVDRVMANRLQHINEKLWKPIDRLIFQPLEERVDAMMNTMRLGPVRSFLRALTQHVWFERVMAVIIVANAVFLSLDHYQADESLLRVVYIAQLVFAIVYTVELLLKVIAMGPRQYLSKPWNAFDVVVVTLSLIEVITSATLQDAPLRYLSVIRVLRLFNLATLWYSLERVLRTVLELKSYAYLSLLVLFYTFVFALIGRQLFAGKFDFDGQEKPRWHFDSLYWSFLTCWQIINGDTWTTVMQDGMRVHNLAAIFFIVCYFFGALVMMKLFTSLLVDKFSKIPEERVDPSSPSSTIGQGGEEQGGADDDEDEGIPTTTNPSVAIVRESTNDPSLLQQQQQQQAKKDEEKENEKKNNKSRKIRKIVIKGTAVTVQTTKLPPEPEGRTFFLFSAQNPVRRAAIAITNNSAFDYLMFCVILFNCVILAIDTPSVVQHPDSLLGMFLYISDVVCLVIYMIETMLKMIAWGVILGGSSAYLRPGRVWNYIDLLVIILSIAALIFPALGPVRALRSLRILRGVSRFEGSKVATKALISALPTALNVGLVVALFWFIFAVVGVSMFQGRFYRCTNATLTTSELCLAPTYPNSTIPLHSWVNPPYNFDNLGAALLSLFQVAGGVAGVNVMYDAIDVTQVGQAPVRDSHPEYAIYFVVFTIVGKHFALNLLSGAVIDNFVRMKNRLKGSAFLSDAQRKWLHTQRILMKLQPSKPLKAPLRKDIGRRMVWRIVTSLWFLWAINLVIIANIIVLSLRFYTAPTWLHDSIDTANWVFLAIYTVEATMKLTAFGFDQYLGSGTPFSTNKKAKNTNSYSGDNNSISSSRGGRFSWMTFEFFIVIASFGVLVAGLNMNSPLVRLLRALPVLRLVKQVRRLRVVFDTLVFSLPSIWNVAMLLFVVYYMYAIAGMYMLGGIQSTSKNGINAQVNFSDFGMAMLTLFRVSTLDTWPYLMYDSRQSPEGTEWAWAYFVSFIVIQVYVLLNLLLAILMDTYNEFTRVDYYSQWSHFRVFRRLWRERDPQLTGKIPASRVHDLLVALGPPLGFASTLSRLATLRLFQRLNLKLTSRHKVFYEHLLRALTTIATHVDLNDIVLQDRKSSKLTGYTMAHWWAARMVQRKWRLEHQDIKLRQLARYNQLLDSAKLVEVAALHRTMRILETQSAAAKLLISSAANTNTLPRPPPPRGSKTTVTTTAAARQQVRFADVLADPELTGLFIAFLDQYHPTRSTIFDFVLAARDWKAGSLSKDTMQHHEEAVAIAETYIFPLFASSTHSPLLAADFTRAEIATRLRLSLVETTTLFDQLLSKASTFFDDHLIIPFLETTRFVEYSRHKVKQTMQLQTHNDHLVFELVALMQDITNLQNKHDL